MPRQRKDDQAVDAFSAPKELLQQAQLAAKARGMTKSGFYRYCLAKELGASEEKAISLATHAGVGNFNVIQVQSGSGSLQVGKLKSPSTSHLPSGSKGKKKK